MVTSLSQGIKISVECRYESRFSNPENNLYLFSYQISIKNTNPFAIQLLSRQWFIVDSLTQKREVCGEGVIGQKPVVEPGAVYCYSSSCDFNTDTGKMCGQYLMENQQTGEQFYVQIPEFMLMVPHKLN